ncbi:hypothetical protein, partial [Cohnella soli]
GELQLGETHLERQKAANGELQLGETHLERQKAADGELQLGETHLERREAIQLSSVATWVLVHCAIIQKNPLQRARGFEL